jgi:hypothetical protein
VAHPVVGGDVDRWFFAGGAREQGVDPGRRRIGQHDRASLRTDQIIEVGEKIVFEYVLGSLSPASFSTVAVEVYTAMRLLELELEERASLEKVEDNKSA